MSTIKKPQDSPKPIKIPRLRCPMPGYQFIDSTAVYFDASEFSAGQLVNAHGNFNSTQHDRRFLHTIRWKPRHRCCQVMKARLVVKLKSIKRGSSPSSPNAGNDTISLVKNGGVSILSEPIYSSHPFPAGTSVTKSWSLTGSQLDWLNINRTLSIYVQDDTAVKSIKLKLWVCCLKMRKKEKE